MQNFHFLVITTQKSFSVRSSNWSGCFCQKLENISRKELLHSGDANFAQCALKLIKTAVWSYIKAKVKVDQSMWCKLETRKSGFKLNERDGTQIFRIWPKRYLKRGGRHAFETPSEYYCHFFNRMRRWIFVNVSDYQSEESFVDDKKSFSTTKVVARFKPTKFGKEKNLLLLPGYELRILQRVVQSAYVKLI